MKCIQENKLFGINQECGRCPFYFILNGKREHTHTCMHKHIQHIEYVKCHFSLLNYSHQTIPCAERVKPMLKGKCIFWLHFGKHRNTANWQQDYSLSY